MRNSSVRSILIILFVLWIFFVLATFFAVQKPFSGVNGLAVGNSLLDLLVALWLVFIALGLGSWVLQRLQSTSSFGENIVLGTGLGLGIVGLLSFLLGLAGLFHPVVAYVVTIGLTVLAVRPLAQLFRQRKNRQSEDSPRFPVIIYLVLFAIFTFLVALLPPADWDGLFYHLTGPKLYIQAGGIIGGIDIPHLSFPALMEMLFAWAMLLRGDIAAKLLHTVYAFLLAGLIYLIARRFMGRKAVWPALLIFASMPMVNMLAGWAYNDLALAFYQLAALYNFISWANAIAQKEINHSSFTIRNSPLSWLVLSGLCGGLAMGLKYTGFVTPLVIIGLIIWTSYRQSSTIRHIFRNLAAFTLPALLVALPWYIKNWVFTGNPVYPFLYGVFGGQYWNDFRAEWYSAGGTGIGWQPVDFLTQLLPQGVAHSLSPILQHYLDLGLTLLTLPWLLVLGFKDMNYWDGRTGPLLLLLLPFIIWAGFSRRSDKPAALGALLIYGLAQYLFWTLGVFLSRSLWQSRLLLSGLVALAPVAGWAWVKVADIKTRHFSLGRFVNIAIGLTLVLVLIDIGLLTLQFNPLPYLTGLESRDEYLTRRLGAHYSTMERINETLPADAVVVFLWEPRSYYCRRDCRPDSILDTFPNLTHEYGSAEAIARTWQQAGITHILVHRSGLEFMLNGMPEAVDVDILDALETQFLQSVFKESEAYEVYKLAK